MFTGGALNKFSIAAMGITPYINASIIMQLVTVVIPKLEDLQKDGGEQGRRQLAQYTRYLTVCLALAQGTMMTIFLSKINQSGTTSSDLPTRESSTTSWWPSADGGHHLPHVGRRAADRQGYR